ncbi:MAG: hypothetical protein GY949_12120, partial [Gammaproteobacteria bacterium]|nr:hypothetical protein [Gammaproteobacteria bacterium]
ATEAAAGIRPLDQLLALEAREAAFGAVNMFLCFAALFIAVIKPTIGKTKF